MKRSDSSAKPKAEAEKSDYLSALKSTDYSPTFDEVSRWTYAVNNQKESALLRDNIKERKLQRMKRYFLTNKLRLAYPVIALAILIAACSMPVTTTETAAQMITWTVPANNTDAVAKINALPWLKNVQYSVSRNNNNGKETLIYNAVLPNASDELVKGYSNELGAIDGVMTVNISPVKYDKTRPLYSAALNNIFSINIDATGMSDNDLQNKIQQNLKDQGVEMNVEVQTTKDGKRELRMNMPEGTSNKDPKNFELRVEDNNGKEQINMVSKKVDAEKFKGKTDDEIRKMVKDENPGLNDSDIKIIRDGDKVQVKVEVDKKETAPRK